MTDRSETPRTDRHSKSRDYVGRNEELVSSDFARTLERELISANAMVERLKEELAELVGEIPAPFANETPVESYRKQKVYFSNQIIKLGDELLSEREKVILAEGAVRQATEIINQLQRQQDGRAVTGGSNNGDADCVAEEKDGSPCATVESSASEERDSSSPSVVYRCPRCATSMQVDLSAKPQSDYLRGFRDCREMAAKVSDKKAGREREVMSERFGTIEERLAAWAAHVADTIASEIRSIEPGE